MEMREGGCHCKKVRFSAELDLSTPVIDCNCTHCKSKGLLLLFIPMAQFTLRQGEDNLTEYLFNKKKIRHLFCSTCGVESFSFGVNKEGGSTVAINVRALDDIDLSALELMPFDGKHF